MPITSLVYTPPIRRPRRAARPDFQRFDEAQVLGDAGDNRAALHKIVAHLFPAVDVPDLATMPFTFSQGSSRVTLRIEGDELAIWAPLVKLPTGGRAVAALRYVLSEVSDVYHLHQPRLRGDDIHLEFREKLARLHPAKVLDVLRSLPVLADRCEDWLIGQFGALPLDRAPIEALGEEELQRADAEWRTHWSVIEELTTESQRNCSDFFLNSLAIYAIHRVRFVLPLRGFLCARLKEAAATFNDREVGTRKRQAALARFAGEMKSLPGEKLRGSLGHAEYGISVATEGTAKHLRDFLGPAEYSDAVDELRMAGRPMDAALALVGTYTYLLAAFEWPAPVEAALEDGLAKASGKPWREAAALLFEHGRELVVTFAGSKKLRGGVGRAAGPDELEATRG
jgi:hypothetical protein